MTKVPHFDLPFRFHQSIGQRSPVFQTTEQDTLQDVTNCVEVILRYPRGFRSDVPEFGIDDLALRQQPLPLDDLFYAVGRWEPRARVIFDQRMDLVDTMIARITANVSGRAA